MLTLNRIFSDGMVLQREKPLRIWGSAEPGQVVTVEVQGASASATADRDGRWSCVLGPLQASECERIRVQSGAETRSVSDVAVGEVLVAAGQSNMEFWMRYDREYDGVRDTCANPRIRFYDVPKCSYPGQIDDFDYSEVGVWRKASPQDLERFSAVGYWFQRVVEEALDVPVAIVGCNYGGTSSSAWMRPDHARAVVPEQVAAFEEKLAGLSLLDLLANGRVNPRNDKGYATWPAWNELFLPRTPTDEEAWAFMEEEGRRASEARAAGLHPGLMTPAKDAPGSLFTYMVEPFAGFAVRAVLWYQGESDDDFDGTQGRYAEALRTIIGDWREASGDANLPFLVVQLSGCGSWMGVAMHDYPTIRACQQEVADEMAYVWLASVGDAGDEFDIHPKFKRPVGERLALLALRHLYGLDVLADAPRLAGASRDGRRVRLEFENAGDGLEVEGASICDLEVMCGGRALAFEAHVTGSAVVIELGCEPTGEVCVRFAKSNWYRVNLYNRAHVPALPFEVTLA